MKIETISAWQIYDSRGFPTVEAEVRLENGARGVGIAPSGASTGQFEALELRDQNPKKFRGKSVFKAITNIQIEIAPTLRGENVFDQAALDKKLIELDGTPNKSRLGANAILPVSMAAANAAANASGKALYEHLGNGQGTLLPIPEIQIIGGGAHANWRTDV
jgi:enolase